ncbi:RNA polymerase sigma-70 factor [Chitinophaga alhagiae]|uniref:RNA polymerase sigma-70 factor n=1 Tax=Chitinophaga alhagiae TaxID=2203219 RepID=UPI001ABFED8F|nr:RNA polymerase sigma-70 factor [Chitinophaga alhagiae]
MSTAEVLFREYYARLCHYAFQFTADAELARDIAQESFVSYLARQEEVSTHPAAVRNFLYTAVRNACLNTIRHNKVVEKFIQEQAAGAPGTEAAAINTIIRTEVLAAIHRALDSLPEECARIVRMGYIDGLKNQEIAKMLNISVNTVKTQKRRGLQLLRLRLPPEMYVLVAYMLLG